jgi:hypothetical protein
MARNHYLTYGTFVAPIVSLVTTFNLLTPPPCDALIISLEFIPHVMLYSNPSNLLVSLDSTVQPLGEMCFQF